MRVIYLLNNMKELTSLLHQNIFKGHSRYQVSNIHKIYWNMMTYLKILFKKNIPSLLKKYKNWFSLPIFFKYSPNKWNEPYKIKMFSKAILQQ